MGSDIHIQSTVIADVIARVTAEVETEGRSDPVYAEGSQRVSTATAISVGIISMVDELPAEGGISGFHRIDLEIDAQTYMEDDKTGATCRTIAGICRKAFSWDNILSLMAAHTTSNTYLYIATTGGTQFEENKVHHRTTTIQILMRPSN